MIQPLHLVLLVLPLLLAACGGKDGTSDEDDAVDANDSVGESKGGVVSVQQSTGTTLTDVEVTDNTVVNTGSEVVWGLLGFHESDLTVEGLDMHHNSVDTTGTTYGAGLTPHGNLEDVFLSATDVAYTDNDVAAGKAFGGGVLACALAEVDLAHTEVRDNRFEASGA